MQLIGYGAAPMTETLLRRAIDVLNCAFLGVYGMTETAGTVVVLQPADHDPEARAATCCDQWDDRTRGLSWR